MSNEEFRVLMDLVMCSDPWPLSETAHGVMSTMLLKEAKRRSYDTWIDAYHHHQPMEVT